MNYATAIALTLCAFWARGEAEQYELEQYQIDESTTKPYVFSYSAGRLPGHVDRVHSETGDEYGNIRGMYSYVDPRQQIRTVEYVADQDGFHPLFITNPTEDTKAVQNAKAKHQILFNRIAAEHQRLALERGRSGGSEDDGNYEDHENGDGSSSSSQDVNLLINHPKDTPTVERAKLKHYDLFNKIALEHAKIAAERGHYGDEESPFQQEKTIKIGYYDVRNL